MTSAQQMSSRKPTVAQSTFGFPDDPFLGARAFQPAANSVHPAPASYPTRNLRPETPPSPSPCPPCLSWLNLTTPKNVEKLSFQARLSAVNREPKKFCKLNWPGICRTFHAPHPAPDPSPILGQSPLGLSRPQPTLPIAPSHCFPSLPSLPSLRTAPFFFPVLCLGKLGGRRLRSRKNVEKLSFGPHRLACTSKAKKLFHPPFQLFPPHKTVPLSPSSLHFSRSKRGQFSPLPSLCALCPRCALCHFAPPRNVEKLSFQARPQFAKRTSLLGNWMVGPCREAAQPACCSDFGKPILAFSRQSEDFSPPLPVNFCLTFSPPDGTGPLTSHPP